MEDQNPNPEIVEAFRSGEPIRASDMNALLRAVRKSRGKKFGKQSITHDLNSYQTKEDPYRVKAVNATGNTILPYSVFTLEYNPSYPETHGPTFITLTLPSINAGRGFIGQRYYTNGSIELANEQWSWVDLIDHKPFRLTYDQNSQFGIPKVGNPCGPNDQGKIENHLPGFVCLSPPQNDPSAAPQVLAYTCWVIQATEAVYFGQVATQIAIKEWGKITIEGFNNVKPGDPGAGGMGGCGTCTYEWNGSSWALLSSDCTGGCSCTQPTEPGIVVDQQTTTNCSGVGAAVDWELNVYNPHGLAWNTGTKLKATPVYGWGYVVEPYYIEECPEDPVSPQPLSFV